MTKIFQVHLMRIYKMNGKILLIEGLFKKWTYKQKNPHSEESYLKEWSRRDQLFTFTEGDTWFCLKKMESYNLSIITSQKIELGELFLFLNQLKLSKLTRRNLRSKEDLRFFISKNNKSLRVNRGFRLSMTQLVRYKFRNFNK